MTFSQIVDECTKMVTLVTFESIIDVFKNNDGIVFSPLKNPVRVSRNNLQQFDKIVDNIWANKKESVYYWTKKTVQRYLLDVLREIHFNGISCAKQNEKLKARWEELFQGKRINYNIVFPLYGVIVDNVTQISSFTAYNATDYKEFIEKDIMSKENILTFVSFDEDENYLVFSIKAREADRAIELAKPYFELFEYIAKFWIPDSLNLSVGIFRYKKWYTEKGFAISENDVSASFDSRGAIKNVNISALVSPSIMKQNWEIMTRYINGQTTEIENRIINAIRWVGMANSDESNVTKHVQYTFALEALLTYKPDKEIIVPSISHLLAESAAFIIGENADPDQITKSELRKKMFHEVKKVYSSRSKVVHGNDMQITDHEVTRVFKLVYMLIFSFLQNNELMKLNSMNELAQWIEEKRFA